VTNATEKRRIRRRAVWLAAGLLLLAGIMLLRYLGTEQAPASAAEEATAAPVYETEAPVGRGAEETAKPEAPEETPVPAPTDPPETAKSVPAAQPPERPRAEIPYTEESYGLVSDIVYTYRHLQSGGADRIRSQLEKLKGIDPALGEAWEGVMDTWAHVNTDLEIRYEGLPGDLAEDDSLCIVVMGFELLYDGAMAPELVKRCELALECAAQYPEAYIALTGGPTALRNKEASEAGVMAEWFAEHGVDPDRLILEDRSKTSAENAQFTIAILRERYPQVRSLAIVSSGYHIPMACLLFQEAALFSACESGTEPVTVAANAAISFPGPDDYVTTAKQAEYLWTLADPHY